MVRTNITMDPSLALDTVIRAQRLEEQAAGCLAATAHPNACGTRGRAATLAEGLTLAEEALARYRSVAETSSYLAFRPWLTCRVKSSRALIRDLKSHLAWENESR